MRQPEIQDLELAIWLDADIRRLEIAMNHAVAVRRVQCRGQLHTTFDGFGFRHWAGTQAIAQSDSRNVLEHQEIDAVLTIQIVNGRQIGMGQLGYDLSFLAQSLARQGIANQFEREDLDCDRTIEVRVMGLVNNAHAPSIDSSVQPVMPQHAMTLDE
jgi:hypothetical protein